jgi:hypothetical protein
VGRGDDDYEEVVWNNVCSGGVQWRGRSDERTHADSRPAGGEGCEINA